jgi:hypothetical protein
MATTTVHKLWPCASPGVVMREDEVIELVRRGSLNAGRQAGYKPRPIPKAHTLVIADSGFGSAK